MKRILALSFALIACLTLAGCSKDVGGTYRLDYATADGVRISTSNLGITTSFTLEEDGVGTATYSGTTMGITWAEDGNEVVVTNNKKELRFYRDGKNLVLHDNGTMLFFALEEEEEDD